MGRFKFSLLAGVAIVLAACSGTDNTLVGDGSAGGNQQQTPDVATLTLLTSSTQIPSDGTANATITALVQDTNNNVMQDVGVVFTADSGSLVVSQPMTTDANGTVTATLSTAGDPTNRTITVTALAAGTVQSTVAVDVLGTSVRIDGPNSLPLGDTGDYTVVLTDAGDNGIGNQTVTLASSNGNGLSQTDVMTNAAGEASFSLTADNGGDDTLSASALGVQVEKTVTVSPDAFAFVTPDPTGPLTEVDLGNTLSVQVQWEINGAPVSGRPVTFSTTRGTVSSATVNTDASGVATVMVSSNDAGPAVITATNDDATSIQLNIEFVATTPSALELQAAPYTVPINDQSTITAVVRDANGNLVKNQIVSFVLNDVTGGSLSVAQATTNSQGRAQTVYNASGTTSSVDGVQIDATVQGFPAVTNSVNLTVAQREVFITIGTGNEIFEPNSAQYRKEWVVQVTDAQGNGVDGVDVTLSVLSERYWDGARSYDGNSWVTRPGIEALPAAGCVDEDINNRNGVLDPGEDLNNNGRIEAGNIALASAQVGGGSTVTTDANGFAIVDVYWPQEYAYWLEVTLEARTAVQGTESAESTTFLLDGAASDFQSDSTAPPGPSSPFGTDGDCATPPPPDGP
jgi:hypothetical protein